MKPTRLFWNGKRLKDFYVGATRFEMVKFKVRRFLRKVVLVSIAISLLYGAVRMGAVIFPNVVYAVQEKQVLVDNLKGKVDELKREVLSTLQKCESAGHKESDGIIIFDSNNVPSIGTFQFQRKTVVHYYKSLYNETITPKEAVIIALDDDKAEKLASDIIFTTEKGLSNWINCSNKHGLSGQVSLIKKLEK